MKEPSVIVLEFNELTPGLMHQWMEEGKLPGFKRLFDESITYVTDAEEPEATLEPWIQWVTVHSGLTYKEHRIFDLGDGHKLDAPRLWDVACNAGKRVWVCGSMNAGVNCERVNGAILPDPWATGFNPHPEAQFKDFFKFVQTNVQEYTRRDVPLTARDHLRFMVFMARNGLSLKTAIRTVKQLISERGGHYHWRRAMILDRFMWDVFRANWRRIKPHYATLFLNSTAHLQHYHWRNMDPIAFELQPDEKEQSEYRNAILQGYQAMDDIVLEALNLIKGTNTSLVMMTALSQQALTRYENTGGKQLFKVNDPNRLLKFAGVEEPARYEPVMAEEFRLIFETEAIARDAQEKLLALTCDGQPLIRSRQDGAELFLYCAIIKHPGDDAIVTSRLGNHNARFFDLFYPMLDVKSGRHHPDGMFWVRKLGAKPHVVPGKIALQRTTATLAELASLDSKTIEAHFVSPGVLDLEQAWLFRLFNK